jgi:cell division protein FtsI/penicillin-binding protein 2
MYHHAHRRLSLVAIVLAAVAAMLVVRLVGVQVVAGAEYREQGQDERFRESVHLSDAPRGSIRDRNGFLLAGNRVQYSVEATVGQIQDLAAVARELAPILQTSPTLISATLRSASAWVTLERAAGQEQGEAIQELGLAGIDTRLWWARVYPQGELTAHLIGFVTGDGEGWYGLEGFYDDELRPEAQTWAGELDPLTGGPLPLEEGRRAVPPPLRGVDLELTLDLAVQAITAQELARGLTEFGAEGGTIIVMDPHTGAILAMVNSPSYDPQRFVEYAESQPGLLANPAVFNQYEPGSVFKIVTVAAALDSGIATRDTTYADEGSIEVGGRTIQNWDRRAYGLQDMAGLLTHSLNVGSAWLSLRMGPDLFYQYVRAFGIGTPTGVDLEGEMPGRLRTPGDLRWHDSDLGANAYGQGLAVTPLQMISAVAAVANEGRLMRPFLVSRQVMPDGTVRTSEPVVRGQPISADTARALTEMLVQVVEEGVPQAHVPGYRIAGKTGTAEIPVPGGYDPNWTIASFVGYGPVEDPQLIILVRLDRPRTARSGAETAAVVFSRLASRLFALLGIPPQG